MKEISNQLASQGFSICALHDIIKRNNFSRKFSTSQFFCIFISGDDLSFKVEDELYHIKAGNSIFVGPHKVIELLSNHTGDKFYIIAFSEQFYDSNSKDSIFLNSELFFNKKSYIFSAPYFGNSDFNKIVLVDRLLKFSSEQKDLFKAAAHNIIEALLIDGYSYLKKDSPLENPHDRSNRAYFNKFKILLNRDIKKEKTVSYYAEILRISPRRLSEICEGLHGKSAKQIIIDKLKFECEKIIKFTTKSMSEITYELGFSDEANFTNFVKRHLEQKPSEIRKLNISAATHIFY